LCDSLNRADSRGSYVDLEYPVLSKYFNSRDPVSFKRQSRTLKQNVVSDPKNPWRKSTFTKKNLRGGVFFLLYLIGEHKEKIDQ
jgi:hypothetical protein